MIINFKDLYTYTINIPLNANGATIGTTIISYEIRRYRDVRNLSNKLAYQILCTQRIIIPNSTPYVIGSQNITAFDDYPAVVTNNIAITSAAGGSTTLVKYTPKTINSSVNISTSSGTGANTSASYQHTSGSSTSQSDTYGASASLGFFGDALTGGVSADYSHTSGSEQSKSDSVGGDSGSSSDSSTSESMSVKDWACYSYIDAKDNTPTWVWGQEYPWDVIKFNNTNGGTNIVLPDFVVPLLCDATQALPPSQMSLFGLDFTMSSVWIVDPNETTITHKINYCTASHSYVPSNGTGNPSVTAHISTPQSFTYTSPSIDLCTYGLDPILGTNVGSAGAIIGFIPNKFLTQPVPVSSTAPATQFRVISSSNNLMIVDSTSYPQPSSTDAGAGFTSSETALTAKFTQNCTRLQIELSFKIVDTLTNYILFMKHWKTNATGIMLQMVINGDTQNTITKYVDALAAAGGENNLLSIALRNLDYGSVDYHDFLQLGLNTIQITITPNGSYTACGYQIRAISVERS